MGPALARWFRCCPGGPQLASQVGSASSPSLLLRHIPQAAGNGLSPAVLPRTWGSQIESLLLAPAYTSLAAVGI